MQVGPRYRRPEHAGFASLIAKEAVKYAGRQAGAYWRGDAKRAPPARASSKGKRAGAGSAAPILQNKGTMKSRARRYRAKNRKCANMKGKKLRKEVCKIANAVKDLRLAENASLGNFTHKTLFANPALTSAAGNNYGVFTGIALDMSIFQESCQYLKYYNPSTPGTLTVADFETGTFDRRVLFKSVYFSMTARNNYQTDAKVRIYLCTPKQSSSISPTTAWQNGIDSNGDASLTSYLQVGQFPMEYTDFRDTWTAKLHASATLAPGQSLSASHSVQNVEFDPSAYDQHTALYQAKYKNFLLMAVVEGTVAHDSAVAGEQGLCQAGVDIAMTRVSKVQYDAGINTKFIKVSNNYDTFTNGAVQSHQPTPDNIGYSVA